MKILPCSNSTKCYGMYMYVYISIHIDDLPIKQNGDFQWLCHYVTTNSPRPHAGLQSPGARQGHLPRAETW